MQDSSLNFNINTNGNSRNLNVVGGMGFSKDDRSSISDQAFHCSASSVESLPSASGSSEFHFLLIFWIFRDTFVSPHQVRKHL
jgi:hypothetical protein